MIRALIFDCFGVLYSDGRSKIDSFAPPENARDIHDLYRQSDYGYISRQEFLSQLSELTGASTDELKRYTSELYYRNDSLINLIHKKKHDYKIGMLSNVGRDFIQTLFSNAELNDLFDACILSSDHGVVKPSREIYEIAARELNVPPSECLFTDDIQDNVDGAELAGMSAVRFTSTQQFIEQLTAFEEDSA